MNNSNFVNESRNVVWLSGYVRGGDETELLLYQSTNEDRAIPIRVSASTRRPRPNAPVEIKCHAFGYQDESGKNWVRLDAIQIKRASVTATPRRIAALNALRPRSALAASDYTPFISVERVRAEVMESLKLDEQAVNSLLDDASKRTSVRDGFQNKAILSGFVGHKAYIGPQDDGTGDLGHVLLQLHQSAEVGKALHVRVQGADSRFGKELKVLHPVAVIGQIRVQATKDDEGNVTARRLYIATDRNSVGFATVNEFARKAFPTWWLSAVQSYYEQRREMIARTRDKMTAAAAAPVNDAAVAPAAELADPPAELAAEAAPKGVSVTDEVF